jgi:hypothetical protein
MDVASDAHVSTIRPLVDALLEHVVFDDEPFFISDEAALLDVSAASPEELQRRIGAYYKTAVTIEDLRRPLWQLLPELEGKRLAAEQRP